VTLVSPQDIEIKIPPT